MLVWKIELRFALLQTLCTFSVQKAESSYLDTTDLRCDAATEGERHRRTQSARMHHRCCRAPAPMRLGSARASAQAAYTCHSDRLAWDSRLRSWGSGAASCRAGGACAPYRHCASLELEYSPRASAPLRPRRSCAAHSARGKPDPLELRTSRSPRMMPRRTPSDTTWTFEPAGGGARRGLHH